MNNTTLFIQYERHHSVKMHMPTLLSIWYYERGLMQNTDYILAALLNGVYKIQYKVDCLYHWINALLQYVEGGKMLKPDRQIHLQVSAYNTIITESWNIVANSVQVCILCGLVFFHMCSSSSWLCGCSSIVWLAKSVDTCCIPHQIFSLRPGNHGHPIRALPICPM